MHIANTKKKASKKKTYFSNDKRYSWKTSNELGGLIRKMTAKKGGYKFKKRATKKS